jgi:hypothetical protein
VSAQLVTAADVASALSMTPRWVLAEARAGRLPCVRLGRAVRFELSAVERFVSEHRVAASVPLSERQAAPRARSRALDRRRVPTLTPPARLEPERRVS